MGNPEADSADPVEVDPSLLHDQLQVPVGVGEDAEVVERVAVDDEGVGPGAGGGAADAVVADQARVNAATVVRTARQLGFSGWPELRLELRNRYLSSLSLAQTLAEHEPQVDSPASDALRRDIENLETLAQTVDVAVIERIAAAMNDAGKTVVVGSGSFAAPGVQLSYCAGLLGLDARLERHFGTQLSNAMARLTEDDCLVVANFWQTLRPLKNAVNMAARRGATICVLTDLRTSPLAEDADHVVVMPSEGVSFFPMMTAAAAVVHAILAELTRLRGDAGREAMRTAEAGWREMELSGD